MIELSSPFLTRQLIAYIGNKRRLLKALHRVFSRLETEQSIKTMLDPFCGSGSVSRLGKYMGYKVFANDWEEYSRIINYCYLGLSPQEAEDLYSRQGGLKNVLFQLNNLEGEPSRPYFSKYYSPENTLLADYRRERLFYTRENGLFLDRVREKIETLYPLSLCSGDRNAEKAKNLLIAMLIYEAATHANTSGVFKACHKGFGGHGRDALKRIMAPMSLEYPVLIDGMSADVGSMDARDWCAARSADLCYLDPPYNIHQYGSNYHMLNSVARWDLLEVPVELDVNGIMKNKAGIRNDWQNTRSPFCRKKSASGALRELLGVVDARYIVLSYNSDGVIPFDELMDILSDQGRVELFAENYTQYRGGKQGLNRTNLTTEFQLVVHRGQKHRPEDSRMVERFLTARKIAMLVKNGLHPERVKEKFPENQSTLQIGNSLIELSGGIYPVKEAIANLDFTGCSIEYLVKLKDDLLYCRFRDNQEEAISLLERIGDHVCRTDLKAGRFLSRRFMVVLKKLAHKKYREIFCSIFQNAQKSSNLLHLYPGIDAKFQEIDLIAQKRFNG